MPRITLLGVPIDSLMREEAVFRMQVLLRSEGQHHVVTPNSEMLVEASRNPAFKAVLQKSALSLPDSSGLVWAARCTGQSLPERVTGVDTVSELCKVIDESIPVFLLGAGAGVADRAAKNLWRKNSHFLLAGVFAGSPRPNDAAEIIHRINEAKPALLLVAFGSPLQELWIARYLDQLPSVRVAIGVGGTFDFLAGNTKRAPRIFQMAGLEWLWRLLLEPRRLPRILNAVVVFPWLVFVSMWKQPGAAAL